MSQYEPLPLESTSRSDLQDLRTRERHDEEAIAHEGLLEDRSKRSSRIHLKSLLSAFFVFVSTSGLGLAVTTWLFINLKVPTSEVFRSGYMLVDEGVKRREGSMESATLRALTATSFISTLISATSPVLMALIAYRIAHMWVTEECKPVSDPGKQSSPTPLQYGLLIQVLSASSVITLFDSVSYLAKGKYRARTPSYFAVAVLLGVVVYALTHLVGLADLWLHATTSTVLFNLTTSGNVPVLKTSLAFNESRCGPGYYRTDGGRTICLTMPDGWAYDNPSWVTMGQAVIANYSVDRHTITLADEDDLAIVIPKSVGGLVAFKASSFGARSQCRTITSECGFRSQGSVIKNCSNLGINAIPTDDIVSAVFVQPYHQWTGPAIIPPFGPSRCCLTNPVQSLLQIRWRTGTERAIDVPNTAVYGGYPLRLDIYALCNLTFYNLTITYDGRAADGKYWSVVPGTKTLSTESFASTLAGPFSWQLTMNTLTSNIQSRAMLSDSNEQVEAAINQELSRLALGFVANAFFFEAATDVTIFRPIILGRYPIVPLFVFVGLLFFYGMVTLAVFVATIGVKSAVISVPQSLQNASSSNRNEIPAVELARLRLLSPLPLIAQVFEPPIRIQDKPNSSAADVKSVAMSELELFSENQPLEVAETRLRLGLEDTGVRPRYGVWKRQ